MAKKSLAERKAIIGSHSKCLNFSFPAQAPKRKATVHSLLVEDEGSNADAAAGAGTEDGKAAGSSCTPAKKARMLDEIKKVFSPTKAATATPDADHVEIKEDDYDDDDGDDDDKPMIVDLKESDVVFTDYQDDDHSSQVRESLTVKT